MTQQEFSNLRFGKGMKVSYDGGTYWIRSVDFQEMLLGLLPDFFSIDEASKADSDEITWVRCENCELLTTEQIMK